MADLKGHEGTINLCSPFMNKTKRFQLKGPQPLVIKSKGNMGPENVPLKVTTSANIKHRILKRMLTMYPSLLFSVYL
jgi:hypothetical protein